MTELSPAAYAVLSAVTQRKYSLDPEDIPQLAASIRSGVSIALRAAVVELRENLYDPVEGKVPVVRVEYLHAIAGELEAQ